MDEKQAWVCFAHSGKIEDYIRYAQLKNRAGEGQCMAQEGQRAGKNPGAYHPGTAGGGE